MAQKYDDEGNMVPAREFLILAKMLLKKAEAETGGSLADWLGFVADDGNIPIDDDVAMLRAVHKILKKNYLDPDEKLNMSDAED